MNNYSNFTIHLQEHNGEKYAAPPEDSLGELSHFELGLKLFCFECDRPVSIEIGEQNDKISCDFKEFRYLSPNQFTLKSRNQHLELNKTQVITELKGFVEELMEMAVNGGYITPEEKQEFLMPLREIAPVSVIC